MISGSWPYLTGDTPAVPIRIREIPSDFQVEEIPTRSGGKGDHVWFEIEKSGITTREAARRIARELDVSPNAIGKAGSKDAHAVTRQIFSLEHVDPDRLMQLNLPDVRVLRTGRRRRKLRIGQLRGNRFLLKLRGVDPARKDDIGRVLTRLLESGVPNYFGHQRFGVRGDTWEAGRALLRGDFRAAARSIAGSPSGRDTASVAAARQLFDVGDYESAARAWPRGFPDCVQLCRDMAHYAGDAERAVRCLDRGLLRFYVSSYQSWMFNQVVAKRMDSLDHLFDGDLAWKHDSGAVFRVEDAAAEDARLQKVEISPSGPLFGRRMSRPAGIPAEIEESVLADSEESAEVFRRQGPWGWRGGRRPLRVPMTDLGFNTGVDSSGAFVELRFVLPAGSYATAVLRELGKDLLVDATLDRRQALRVSS